MEEIEQNGYNEVSEPDTTDGRIYSIDTTEITSDMGAIPRAMVNTDGRFRGNHPTNSFVALGPEAEKLISCQTPENVYAPFQMMMEMGGRIIMMGVDLTKMTAIHYAEQLSGREMFVRWALDENGNSMRMREGSCSDGFNNLASVVSEHEKRIMAGKSLWRIFPILETVKACAEAIRNDSSITHCGKTDCRCDDMAKGGPVLSTARAL
jgi:aminoglycoside 3-N-acetyltransferase